MDLIGDGGKKLSTLRHSEVSRFGSNLKSCINGASIGRVSSGLVSKVAAFGSVR